MAFADTWAALQTNLLVGATISNWTAHHGLLGDSFSITAVEAAGVTVDAPGAKRLQRIPAVDFEGIYDRWNDYRYRGLQRSAFTPVTRYSKYIISIFRWL